MFKEGFVNRWPESAKKIYQGFLDALENRINLRGDDVKRGKKDCYDWFCRARRDQRAIQDRINRRLCVYQFETKECRKRFSHLLSSYDD